MKATGILPTLALAVPVVVAAPADGSELPSTVLETRGFLTRNDLINGDSSNCPEVILIFARGSTELGNMVWTACFVLDT